MASATGATAPQAEVSTLQIFHEFLIIGATSFGGVVPYLRGSLVTKRRWIDDKEFVEMLSISQSLPGLNATNMAVIVGEKLRGVMGAIAAIIGICLPGGVLMFAVGIFYHQHGDHAFVTAALKGMAAFPDMKILTVDVHHWLNFAQLIHLYSVGQMAPGPNMMMIVSIG